MPSNYKADDPILGQIDLDDKFVTDAWLIDQFVGNKLFTVGRNAAVIALGLSDTTDRSSPVQVGSLVNWKSITPGYGGMFAIKNDGTLWGWGYNPQGMMGLGDVNVHRSSPVQIGALSNWKQVEIGIYSVLSVKTDGTLWAWGNNNNGQLGLNDIVHRSSPVQVGSGTNWKLVSTAQYLTAAIKTDGTLWTWGKNGIYGALGLNDVVHRSSPVQVGSGTNWKLVLCGTYRVSALKTDNTLWTWGFNHVGQLGLNDVTPRSSPVQVGSLANWKKLGGNLYNVTAIKTDGTLWNWGQNGQGQLGVNDIVHRSSPIQVGSLSNWKAVAWGTGSMSSAIKTDGTLWTWGQNLNGELGQNNLTHYSSPIQVGSLTNWKQVAIGPNYTGFVTFADIT